MVSRRVTAFGQAVEPLKGQFMRDGHALAPPVGFGQPVLPTDMILPGCFFEPVGGQPGVAWHAQTQAIQHPQPELGRRVAGFGQ